MAIPLRMLASAMCCAVGYSQPAAVAAIRAEINHFRQTDFVDYNGNPIIGAQLWQMGQWGPARFGRMFSLIFQECQTRLPDLEPAETALILLVAEPERPGIDGRWAQAAFSACQEQTGRSFHGESRICAWGKAGIAPAVLLARKLFTLPASERPRQVMVAGVDTYFSASTINHYLSANRLLCSDNHDGFIPGEGAGAVVLSPAEADGPALWIDGAAAGREPACYLSDQPSRAQMLCRIMREASAEAQIAVSALDFHASGVSGESWYFREAALAVDRTLEQRIDHFPHELIAKYIGETGAACAPLTLAWLGEVMGRGDGPGRGALLHFANDGGERAALVVRYR
ncbi:hypothetical protein [Chitinimonas lacunae]|uniref:3-oxoacyl-ACP synthase n=1 Tax=Chitinimonas lacunae TaxID=1963018 RepID=A0ABV8MNN7_9NEIS